MIPAVVGSDLSVIPAASSSSAIHSGIPRGVWIFCRKQGEPAVNLRLPICSAATAATAAAGRRIAQPCGGSFLLPWSAAKEFRTDETDGSFFPGQGFPMEDLLSIAAGDCRARVSREADLNTRADDLPEHHPARQGRRWRWRVQSTVHHGAAPSSSHAAAAS